MAEHALAGASAEAAGASGAAASDPAAPTPADVPSTAATTTAATTTAPTTDAATATAPTTDAATATAPTTTVPGLPDDVYGGDGQLTKREVRAITLAALAPRPGELLWDIGAGSGSIAIEWLRAHESCRAVAVEAREDRADRVRANAAALGVPRLYVLVGSAPGALDALADTDAPDAVFIGGGLTVPGVVERCWAALRPGGRLVANAVTAETEAELVRHRADLGGDLTRIQINRSTPVGRFTGWRPLMPVTQWIAVRP
ncbi:precorrin-6Y C5,15-methyltransferase (decarboxylating) subunit CbiT [Yinghuangia sp. YIM S09857]|uniref:precorrin-6Y C5,15-methyltransferase (decarboxylating) subunit CbiT n=1 Tax=Yinghuangia sp. YIM S09857 TaxID=3436929 RepID=UPI003F53A40C